MPSCRLNGTDLRTIGVVVDGKPGFRAAPRRRVTVAPLLRAMGGVATAVTTDPRSLEIAGTLVAGTYAARRALETQVKDLVGGITEVVWDDGALPPQQIEGLYESIDVDPPGPADRVRATRLRIGLTIPDPTWRSVQPTILSLPAATRVSTPLGTAPCAWILRAMGSSPVATYRDAGGREVWSLTITRAITAGEDWFDVDATAGAIGYWDNGVYADAIAAGYLTGGQQHWPKPLDPRDGHYLTSQWPTIECSVAAELLYWRRWQ